MTVPPHAFPGPHGKGFVLLGVIVPLLALLILSSSIALVVGQRWTETRLDLDRSAMEENLDAVLWTLRFHYHNLAVAATTPMGPDDAATIIARALSTLGATGGGAGQWSGLGSGANLAGLRLRLTPISLTNPSAPSRLVGTGTILDGRQVSQGSFTFRVEYQSLDSAATLQATRTLIFCQVPSDALAASGLSDWQSLSGQLSRFEVAGTTYVRGKLDSAVALSFSTAQALQAGSYGAAVSRGDQSLAAEVQDADYRFETEIASQRSDFTQNSSDLRTAAAQRVGALRSAIPPALLFREGVAGDPALSSKQASLYRSGQPFYQVPMSGRYWLTHDPTQGVVVPANPPFPENNYSSGLPPSNSWLVSVGPRHVAGTQQVVMVIDPEQAPDKLFIGSTRQGNPGDNSGFIIELKAAPHLTHDFTLVSPNTVVINGDLNSDQAQSLNLVGRQVCFGYTSFTELTFSGALASLEGISPSPWRNASGTEHPVAQVNLVDAVQTSSPVFYYFTLLQQE